MGSLDRNAGSFTLCFFTVSNTNHVECVAGYFVSDDMSAAEIAASNNPNTLGRFEDLDNLGIFKGKEKKPQKAGGDQKEPKAVPAAHVSRQKERLCGRGDRKDVQ